MIDEQILRAFESVGIPKMQTLVYLDLLKNKESSAMQVSKRTKMHRANVYDTLTKLKERNLVYLSTKEGSRIKDGKYNSCDDICSCSFGFSCLGIDWKLQGC